MNLTLKQFRKNGDEIGIYKIETKSLKILLYAVAALKNKKKKFKPDRSTPLNLLSEGERTFSRGRKFEKFSTV